MARVVIENLSKVFKCFPKDIQAVRGVGWTVEDKELLVLVGPSGCGKTTLLRLIAGLEEASEGTVSIDGRNMSVVPPQDRPIAMVFQNGALYPHMTAYENMAFGLKLRKLPRTEIDHRVREAADMLGLAACCNRLPATLSSGERQRVAVGRALVQKPKVFLLDEPLSNLDAPMRLQMRREMAALHARLGATMVYVTHDQTEAMSMGHRIAVMRDGAMQQIADPITLYRRPVNLFVAGFIGSPPMNFISGFIAQDGGALCFQTHLAENGAIAPGIAVPVRHELAAAMRGYAGKEIVLGIRPENLTVAPLPLGPRPPAGSGATEATVELVEPMGPETYLHLTTGVHSFVARVNADDPAVIPQKVVVVFDPRKAHFFDPHTTRAVAE